MIAIPSPRSRRRARIEIIPLIDIIFFLFATFVMVSLSMVKNRGLAVRLPVAASGAPQSQASSAVVTIAATGELFFNKQAVDAAELNDKLRAAREAAPDFQVIIQGDTETGFGRVVQVLDELRQADIGRICIATRAPAPTPAP